MTQPLTHWSVWGTLPCQVLPLPLLSGEVWRGLDTLNCEWSHTGVPTSSSELMHASIVSPDPLLSKQMWHQHKREDSHQQASQSHCEYCCPEAPQDRGLRGRSGAEPTMRTFTIACMHHLPEFALTAALQNRYSHSHFTGGITEV